MKKAKIILTAITVFAVVGGALAFKAQKYNIQKYCIEGATAGQCTVFLANSSFNTEDGQISYRLTTSQSSCPASDFACDSKGHSLIEAD